MNIDMLIEKIKKTRIKNQYEWNKLLSEEEINIINDYTSFLDENYKWNERIFYFQNQIKEKIKCSVCNTEIRIENRNNIPPTFCSKKCLTSEKGLEIQNKKLKEMWTKKTSKEIEEMINKIKNNKIEKYNDENYNNIEKIKKTKIEKYNDENYNNSEKNKKTLRENNWDSFNNILIAKNIIPQFTKDEYLNCKSDDVLQFKCLNCNEIINFNIKKSNGIEINKINCKNEKIYVASKYEEIINNWLKEELNITSQRNARFYYNGHKFHEIDIYLPEYNLGIDFNGLYWHSELHKDKKYHQEKYFFFKEKNIKLIQIFENEWLEKEDVVKSIIKNKLGIHEKIIGARKCDIVLLTSNEYTEFCNINHVQGPHVASIRIGLIYDNKIVQLLSFAKSRFNKNFEYELIRSCTRKNCLIMGGTEKIFNYFIKNYKPKSIITFSDLRYFEGNSYYKLGFKFSHISSPDYWYFKDSYFFHRSHFQKHKLQKELDFFDENLTEVQNMYKNAWLRIFDCGNLVFHWQKENKNGE